MSMAWEVTVDDVEIVLERHGIKKTEEEISDIHDGLDCDEVEEVVLSYTDFDDQVDAALDEIERQLKADGVIN